MTLSADAMLELLRQDVRDLHRLIDSRPAVLVAEITKMRAAPGDTVVVRTAVPITVEQSDLIRKTVRDSLPRGVEVLVVYGVELTVLSPHA